MDKRMVKLINNNWKFIHGNVEEAILPEYDDTSWSDVGLPHSFGIPYFMEGEFYVGYGCYRKTLTIETNWLDKSISLEFQGAFQVVQVYVNGYFAGEHKGGYTAFEIPITQYLHAGENVLFVRVNNLWDATIAPRAGEHVFNGGIYRDVSLIVTEPVHVSWYGTYVTTPKVSDKEAEIVLETEVVNEYERDMEVKLVSTLVDEGEAVQTLTVLKSIPALGMINIVQDTVLQDPKLWHPDTPKLYQFKSEIYINDCLVDEYETSFGIRWFTFTGDKGFFLNGEHYNIHGANVHQDHAGWSDAVTRSGIRRDIQMIKECGMNFIRGSHYPHHTYFAQVCDELGILFWSENCFWGTGGPNIDGYWTASGYPVREEDEEAFEESCAQTLREMIRTNRNHPSIIVWSMCNEPFFSDANVIDKAKKLCAKLVDLSHELDATRPAAVGGVQRGGFDTIGDLAGYNGDGASIFIDPGFPNFVSEYGSVVTDRPGEFKHRYRDGVETDYEWRSGKALWCGFHHGSILGDMGHMGMIDYYRLPLDTWYWYREELAGVEAPQKPVEGEAAAILLTSDYNCISCDGTEDAQIIVTVVDKDGRRVKACPDISLEVVCGEGIMPTGKKFFFSAGKGNLIEGLGAIEFRSYFAGENVLCAKAEGMDPVYLTIQVTGDEKPGERKLVPMLPPPYVSGMPKYERLSNIGKNRPVFFSSAKQEHPALNVTDDRYETFWIPDTDAPGEWVLVDLEGTKEIKEVTVVFAGITNALYEIALSDDRQEYHTIYVSGENDNNSSVTYPLKDTKARYIRVRFVNKPVPIVKINVNA